MWSIYVSRALLQFLFLYINSLKIVISLGAILQYLVFSVIIILHVYVWVFYPQNRMKLLYLSPCISLRISLIHAKGVDAPSPWRRRRCRCSYQRMRSWRDAPWILCPTGMAMFIPCVRLLVIHTSAIGTRSAHEYRRFYVIRCIKYNVWSTLCPAEKRRNAVGILWSWPRYLWQRDWHTCATIRHMRGIDVGQKFFSFFFSSLYSDSLSPIGLFSSSI